VSGHCGPAGTTVYDGAVPDDFESKNKILFSDVQALGKAMPHAAAQVHDIMLSACSSLRPNQVHEWTDAFPSLCSIQGYGGPVDYHSPTGGLALAHEAVWLSDTRGAGAPHLRSDREISFASHVTLYTKAHGYEEAKK
jgi:hypothetical protein